MNQTYIEDGLIYSASNHRMKYTPEFHENHGKDFTTQELIYMCSMWENTKKSNIALALGRTHGTVLSKAYLLKKNGQFEHFKKLGERISP